MNKTEYRFAAMYGAKYIPYLRDRMKRRPSEIRHDNILNLIKSCFWAKWNFNNALGDTILEKYESLYVRCLEHTLELAEQKTTATVLVANREIASIFETATAGFYPVYQNMKDDIVYLGRINNRWKLYTDPQIDHDLMLLCDEKVQKGLVVHITNFVI